MFFLCVFFPACKEKKKMLVTSDHETGSGWKTAFNFFPLAPYKVKRKRNRQGHFTLHFLLSPFLLSLLGFFFLHLPNIRAE